VHEDLFGINKFCYSEWLFNANGMRQWCTEHSIFSAFWSVNTLYYCFWYYYYHHHPCFTIMQGIYNYIPETNRVSMTHSAAAFRYLQFVLHVMLFRLWNIFCLFCCSCCCCCYCHLHNDVCHTDYTHQTVGWLLLDDQFVMMCKEATWHKVPLRHFSEQTG
jgi:hypothetical protein